MHEYINAFIEEESGVEIIEWIAILAVSAALVLICAEIAKEIKGKMKGLAGSI